MDGIAIFSAFLQGLGVVAFVVRLHELAVTRCATPRSEIVATALTFAVGAAVSMAFPLKFAPGVVFDLRHVFLVLAGPFGGMPAALATGVTCAILRMIQGGIGMPAGVLAILTSMTVGLVFAYLHQRREYTMREIFILGVGASLSLTSVLTLPWPLASEVLQRIALPFMAINFVGVLISAESLNRFRAQLYREQSLMHDRSTDSLTGLFNRRVFDTRGPEIAEDGFRKNGCYALMIVDIDRFKTINDTFGHANGDKVLKVVARMIASHAREQDLTVRYGGEEIALVLPGCNTAQASVIADRIRQGIEGTAIEVSGINLKVTVSVGYVVVDTSETVFWSAFDEADAALYRAKNAGRNRVERAVAA
nr:diguanylate cyclase [Oricola sp.]